MLIAYIYIYITEPNICITIPIKKKIKLFTFKSLYLFCVKFLYGHYISNSNSLTKCDRTKLKKKSEDYYKN